MYQKTKKTPALRFPEFNGTWRILSLSELASKISDGMHSTPAYDKWGEYYFVNGNNLLNGRIVVTKNTKTVDEAEYRKHRTDLDHTSILLSINGTIGSLALFDNEKIVLGKSACYINLNSTTDRIFIYNILQTTRVRNHFLSEVTGSTIKNLSLATIRNCELYIPLLPEQQKIAAFLSAVDQKIEQLTRKNDLLLKYKRGVMRQIFEQKIRFKEDTGNDFPDWKERMFGEVFSFLPTNSLSREDLNYKQGTVKNIHYGDIHTSFRPLFNVKKETVPFINNKIPLHGISDESYCREGDLVFADASEDYSDVGKCIEITNLNGERVLAGLHTLLARPKDHVFAPGFATFLMKSWSSRLQIMREAQGTKVLGISSRRLSRIKLNLPSIPEQQKITAFFTVLDEKLEAFEYQQELMRDFKKGLLQQMFV